MWWRLGVVVVYNRWGKNKNEHLGEKIENYIKNLIKCLNVGRGGEGR